MKLLKKSAAAVTAFAVLASASAAVLPQYGVFFAPDIVSAEEKTASYRFAVSNELYNIDSLKTLEYYNANELRRSDSDSDEIKNGTYDGRYVAEVKLNIEENYGIYAGQIILEYDSDLVFAGCALYDNGAVSRFEGVDDYLAVSAELSKVIITYKGGQNMAETGEFCKLLFILPESPETDHVYKIGFNDKKTQNQIAPWEDDIKISYSSAAGSLKFTNGDVPVTPATPSEIPADKPSETPTLTPAEKPTDTPTLTPTEKPTDTPTVTPTEKPTEKPAVTPTQKPADTPTVTPTEKPADTPSAVPSVTPTEKPGDTSGEKPLEIVLNAGSDKVNMPGQAAEKIEYKDNAVIKVEVPDRMVYRTGRDMQVEFSVNLKDYNAETSYFDFAGLGINLPKGMKIADVKTSVKSNVQKIEEGSLEAIAIENEAKLGQGSVYYMINGIDSASLGSNGTLVTFTVNVPASEVKFINEITTGTAFGRIQSVNKEKDGTYTPLVSFIRNGDTRYTVSKPKLLMGLKGDVDLDGKVSQIDANVILKEILAGDAGTSVLPAEIDMNAAGDKSTALSKFLGDVDGSDKGAKMAQSDANCILKAILFADASDSREFTDEVWAQATK